jgi:hypothetical protein
MIYFRYFRYTSKIWALRAHFASSCGGPAVARTQGLATLASHRAHARARYARFPSRARKSSGVAALAYRCAHARARYASFALVLELLIAQI